MTTAPRESRLRLPNSAKEDCHLIILLCDTPLPPVKESYGTYHDIFESLFSKSFALNAHDDVAGSKELIITSYNVVLSQYPSLSALQSANALLITGSAASAYLPIPWISDLIAYIKELPIIVPRMRILGICFGHQVIGIAFGGTCEVNSSGWEIGVRRLRLSEWGRRIWGGEILDLHQVHQDHVTVLPKGFHSLASTPISEIHGMIKLFPSSSPSSSSPLIDNTPPDLSQIAILTLQGHPEFHADMVLKIINNRESGGIIPPNVASLSRELAAGKDEGIRVGRSLLEIICANR